VVAEAGRVNEQVILPEETEVPVAGIVVELHLE